LRTVLLLFLTSLIAARCPEPSWVVDDDRIFAIVSREGQPVKHAMVQLASPDQRYNATTDENGRFLIPAVAVGKYTLVVKGMGRGALGGQGLEARGGSANACSISQLRRRCFPSSPAPPLVPQVVEHPAGISRRLKTQED
jgi:hypothetical protein